MAFCTIPVFVIWELYTHNDSKTLILIEVPLILPTGPGYTELSFLGSNASFLQTFLDSYILLVNLAVSDQIYLTNTALVQKVGVFKITLTNIICSHICQLVFIDSLLYKKKRNIFTQQVLLLSLSQSPNESF